MKIFSDILGAVGGKSAAQADARVETPMVLHVRVVSGAGGGPDKTILGSARHMDANRWRVGAAYIHPHGDPGMDVIRQHAREHGCPLWEIGESGPLDPRTIRSLVQLCRKQRVTIWHGHDYKSNALGLLIRRFRPMKLVTTVHGWTRETTRTRLYYHIDNACLSRYDEVMAVSPQLMLHCVKHGADPQRLTYIPNAIDTEAYRRRHEPAWVRQQLGIGADRFVIGVVGRLSAEKGVDRAISTLADLWAKYPKAQLHLVGDGPERAGLEKLVRELGLSDRVRFYGWQPDPAMLYEMMDMLLLPSHTEGMPNAVLEAMAMGVPVAATDVGGVRELLEPADQIPCGVLLGQDRMTWADQIAPLIVSADRRAELARRARRHVEAHYSFEKRMATELSVYERLLRIAPTAQPARRAA